MDKIIEISDISLNNDFKEKYRITNSDFACFSVDNTPIDNHIYRFGGLGKPNLKEDLCFLVFRYYPSKMTKDYIKKYNLNQKYPYRIIHKCVIMDIHGNTLKEFDDTLHTPYLKKGTYIYSIGGKYYNAKTSEYYGSGTSFDSQDYIFINNTHDYIDKSKEGVVRINKKTGESLIYKK